MGVSCDDIDASQAKGTKVIVTHGTDTMIESAAYVAARGVADKKCVVFTGSMKPERFYDSDAPFNIGCAVGASSLLNRGAYVCMNGVVMPHESCVRDGESGLFLQKADPEGVTTTTVTTTTIKGA